MDENYGWAVGGGYTSAYPNVGDEHTIILNTTNGGENWSTQFGEIGWPLTAVHFINQNIGLTVGEAGIILKTTDGGNIWTSLTKGNYSNRQSILYSVHFSNLNNGWAVGTFRNSYTGPYYPETFKTTNGGEDWIEQDSIGGKAVFFIDENTGWITAGNIILKTTNGGEDWIEQNSIGGNAIFFIDENTGWITASNIILKTTNGGEDWIEQNNLGGNSIFFIDDYYGWVVGDQGRVLKTTNSGTVWISIPGVSFSDLMSVYFDNQNNGWIAGTLNSPRDGIILRTIDGGLNWSYIITDDPLSSIYFPNEFIGWAIGEEGAVFRTTDRGDNWSKQLSRQITSKLEKLTNSP